MNAQSVLFEKILQSPHDNALRLQLADLLIGAGNPHGRVMRWQCELASLTEADRGWYSRSYSLSNLLRGSNPIISMSRGDSVESQIARELHAIQVEGKNVGLGAVRRGYVEEYTIFDIPRFKSCETAVMRAAPLIASLEFSELTKPEQFSELMSLQLLTRATSLTFKKCKFSSSTLTQLFNLPELSGVKRLSFAQCEFEPGIEQLAQTKVGQQLELLAIIVSKEVATEFQSGKYLGDLLTGDHCPNLRSLELNFACTASDLDRLATWSGLPLLRELEIRGFDWPAELMARVTQNDLRSLQTLKLSGIDGSPEQLNFANCPALRTLSIKGVALNEQCMRTLSETISNTLRHLTLSNCQLTSTSVCEWLQGKPLNEIRFLNLQVNQLDIEAVRQLATTTWLSGLVALKLSFNPLGDQCGAVITNSPVLKQLVFLDLSESGLGDKAAQLIFSSSQLNTLEWLNLDGNSITGKSLNSLMDRSHLTNIVALRLKNNKLFDKHKSDLVERFGIEVVDSYWLGYLI